VRYNARLVTKSFTQRPDVDFQRNLFSSYEWHNIYKLVSLAVHNCLSMQLMDIVTTYLYGSLDSKIYMNVPDGIGISNPKANSNMFLC
jgi:hypothetical protein